MVQIQIQKQLNNYQQITISGHAKFASKGQDIVCSAISAIIFGILNALHYQCQDSVTMITNDSKVVIKVVKFNEINQIVLQTMIYQLLTVMEEYPKNIKIKEF